MSDKIEVRMVYLRPTKNKHVYSREAFGAKDIPTLYIDKKALSDPPPENIVVTVEEA